MALFNFKPPKKEGIIDGKSLLDKYQVPKELFKMIEEILQEEGLNNYFTPNVIKLMIESKDKVLSKSRHFSDLLAVDRNHEDLKIFLSRFKSDLEERIKDIEEGISKYDIQDSILKENLLKILRSYLSLDINVFRIAFNTPENMDINDRIEQVNRNLRDFFLDKEKAA